MTKLLSLVIAREHESQGVGLEGYTVYTVFEFVNGQAKPENQPEWLRSYKSSCSDYVNGNRCIEKQTTKDRADSYHNRTEGGLHYSYHVNPETNWDKILSDILSGELDLTSQATKFSTSVADHDHAYRQFKEGRFHPPPRLSDILTRERVADLQRLCLLLEIPCNIGTIDLADLHRLVTELEQRLSLTGGRFVVDRKRHAPKPTPDVWYEHSWSEHEPPKTVKDTYKCWYDHRLTTAEQRSTLPAGVKSERQYLQAVQLVSILRGRLHNMFAPILSASCLVIDKTGLSQFQPPAADPLVRAFVILVQAATTYHKLSTIYNQMHSGLDRWLMVYLKLLIKAQPHPIPMPHFAPIFLVTPSPGTVTLVPRSQLQEIRAEALSWMNLMAIFFREQWELGVKDCVQKNMMVPRSGTTQVHVNAWNAVAGAWSNLLRLIRLTESGIESEESMQLLKVLKLTAGDQMAWARQDGKGADPECQVFFQLTEMGLFPWSGLTQRRDDFVEKVTKVCTDLKVPPKKWLGKAVERLAEVRPDVTSVCGIVVAPESVPICKAVGAFGSAPWGTPAQVQVQVQGGMSDH